MTLKYDENTKLIGGFKISKVCLAAARFPYYLCHDNDGSLEWVSEATITELLEKPKVKIPQIVAEWIEDCKNRDRYTLSDALSESLCPPAVSGWFYLDVDITENAFARAWLDGYEVEQEKKYTVKFKLTNQYLMQDSTGYFGFYSPDSENKAEFTKQELMEAGSGGVFDNEMFEVQEVVND